MKKVLSIVLALAMVLALAAPAFAAEDKVIDDPSKLAIGATNKVTGTTSVGVLKVTVPTANAVILNPYGLELKVDAATGAEKSDGTTIDDQVISPVQAIKSESTSAIKVSAVVTGTNGGNVKFATATTVGTTDKNNSVFLQLVAATATETAPSGLTAITPNVSVTISDKASAKTELGEIPSGVTVAQYLPFQLQGDAIDEPTNPWTTKDTVGATIAFTFDLVKATTSNPPPATVTAMITEGSGKTSVANGETANLTVALSDNTKSIDSVVWSATNNDTPYISLGGSTNATETATWAAAGGSVTITAVVTYDTTETTTATFTLGTT